MDNLKKFDLWLLRELTNSVNLLHDIKDIKIGRLNSFMNYLHSNPLSIHVQSKKNADATETSIELISENNDNFSAQYIKRIPETPFYISYLTSSQFSIKIIDFNSWLPDNIIYRLMVIKKLDYSFKNSKYIRFRIDKTNQKKNKINNIYFYCTNNLEMKEDYLICNNKNDDYFSIGFAFTSEKFNTLDVNFSVLSKSLKTLIEKCKNEHVKKSFITKNRTAEKELDYLWFKQKYILPDWQIDPDLLINHQNNFRSLLFIHDFYEYFGRGEDSNKIKKIIKDSLNNTNYAEKEIGKSSQLDHFKVLDLLPQLGDLLHYYFNIENEFEINRNLQIWWELYSLPLFEKKFQIKYIHNPEELFLIYFLAIRHNLVWTELFFDKIEKFNKERGSNELHDFLFLLAFINKRISQKQKTNKFSEIIPGNKWDNNYKAIEIKNTALFIEYSKFSKKEYTSITKDNVRFLRLDKLCRISFENNHKIIQFAPTFTISENSTIGRNILNLAINTINIALPLIWRTGELSVFNVRIRWILKKNRFQYTMHSEIGQKIELNHKSYFLEKKKKTVVYQEVKYSPSELNIDLYNNDGRTIHSNIENIGNSMIASGYAVTNYGIISQNMLYKSHSAHKHTLEEKQDSQFQYNIPLKTKISEIGFYAKNVHRNIKLEYFKNSFIDKLANFNLKKETLVIIFDPDFKKDLIQIKIYFKYLIEYQPEYIEFDKKLNTKNISSLFIYFRKTDNSDPGYTWDEKEKNLLIINSSSVETGLKIYSNIVKNNLLRCQFYTS